VLGNLPLVALTDPGVGVERDVTLYVSDGAIAGEYSGLSVVKGIYPNAAGSVTDAEAVLFDGGGAIVSGVARLLIEL